MSSIALKKKEKRKIFRTGKHITLVKRCTLLYLTSEVSKPLG